MIVTVSVLYTDSDRVRAALGLDDADIADTEITESSLEEELIVDLDSWVPTHAAIIAAADAPAATDSQKALGRLMRLYCQFKGAYLLAGQAYRILQKVTDGKNQQARFSNLDWERIAAALNEKAAKYKQLLAAALGDTVNSAVAGYPIMSASQPNFDPITG